MVEPSTERLYREMSRDLRAYLLARVRDPAVADDLLQEVFVRVHRQAHTVRDGAALAGWVRTIARNVVIDHHRRMHPISLDEEPIDPPRPDRSNDQLVASWLPMFLETLPEHYREAVRLADLEELPRREVAERLGISLSAAKSRVTRGRAMLREQLLACCEIRLERDGSVLDVVPRHQTCGC